MSTHIELVSWSELAGVADQLEARASDLAAVTGYARRWVCQGAGFEPSPLCLLRPLARVMDVLAEAFLDLERVGVGDLVALREGVEHAAIDLGGVDRVVAALMPAVA